MIEKPTEKTPKEVLAESLGKPIFEALDKKGITLPFLAQKIFEELAAEETKFIKVKKSEFDPVTMKEKIQESLPVGTRIIVETCDEILFAIQVKSWGTQQAARIDAHKLRGDYPADKLEHDISGSLMAAVAAHLSGKNDPKPTD